MLTQSRQVLRLYRLRKFSTASDGFDGSNNDKRYSFDKRPKVKKLVSYTTDDTTIVSPAARPEPRPHIVTITARPAAIASVDGDALAQRRARRARLLDIWQHRNDYCEANFDNSKAILMLDREPLVTDFSSAGTTNLVVCNCRDLRYKLQEYGLLMSIQNSVLLDFVDGDTPNRPDLPLFGCALLAMRPPPELDISLDDLKAELARSLGGRFIGQRQAIYVLRDQRERELLAKFQGMTYFYHVYRVCPTCASILHMRSSKAFTKCIPCNRRYYPTISPLVNCLVRDPTNEHCLLLRPAGRAPSVYTTILGVPECGESLESTVVREVARSVGLGCAEVRAISTSHGWPPEAKSTLTTAFVAISPMDQKLDHYREDVAQAGWYSREEVAAALRRSRDEAPELERLEREFDAAAGATAVEYGTQRRRPRPRLYDRQVEIMETFDRYEEVFDPSRDYTITIEEPLGREPVQEGYRRHRKEDYNDDRYDLEEFDEDEAEANLPDYHVDKVYQRERERQRREEEARTGRPVVADQEELRQEAERFERRKRRDRKKELMSDAVFQVPRERGSVSKPSDKRSAEPMVYVPPVGTLANSLIQAWVDRKL